MAEQRADRASSRSVTDGAGMLEGFIEALADKHSQMDINFNGVTVRLPNTQVGVELNGILTLTVHMRDLTDDEARASAAKNVAAMGRAKS